MSRVDKYKELFTDQFLMGPNSVRLLDEMLEKSQIPEGQRILDLGCGKGLTSLFLAKETKAQVYATDLWINATENNERFKEWGIDDCVIPIHADANDLPYANEDESSLFNIFVLPEYQGKDVGRKIIETLEKDEYFLRAKRVEIPASITACEFYKKWDIHIKMVLRLLMKNSYFDWRSSDKFKYGGKII